MAYIGREPQVGNFQVCDAISVVNGQAAYTMQVGGANVSPETANHMLVSLNGVLQAPGSSYTVSGSTITFASNLVTGDVINFIHILGSVLDLGVPSDSTVSLAKLTATGTKDATTFLRGDNTFAAAGGGKILQVVEAATTTAATTTSTSYVTTGLEVAITPSATTSKILVFATWMTGFVQSDKDCRFQLFRDSTTIGGGADADRYVGVGGGAMTADTWFNYGFQQFNIQKLDSPSSTSALTYKIMFNVNSGSGATGHFGEQRNGDNAGNNVICAMEIGA